MTNRYTFLILITTIALFSACSQSGKFASSPETAGEVWPEIKKEHRPWSRWWWMGSAVDEKNLDRLLTTYADAGIGGVEIAPIYGAVGYEDRYLEFLSPQWVKMLAYTVKKADSLGMGVDLTQGTGWPFGGPQVSTAQAASKLIVQKYALRGGQALKDTIRVQDPKQAALQPELLAIMAYSEKGEVFNITDKLSKEGRLNWKPAAGNWDIYAAFNGKTRQQVKRAAPGGQGYTLDHLSDKAVQVYLNSFEEVFKHSNLGVRAFYNDSYEVYGADWSLRFFEEFENRRGYDLRLHLRELLEGKNTEELARLKADYRETMGDMLLDNFTRPWTSWAHTRKSLTKNQAHGSPGNLLDLYAAVDIPECETFGSSYFPIPGLRRDSADVRNVDPDPIMLKFASSAGHAAGKNLVSSETFTWLTEHFKTSFAQAKPEVEQVFLSGVNHVFYHGITYSPQDVPWPGWLFYASLNLTPANSLWPHFKGINDYIARCQSVLQAGQPDNELLVYWPVYDVWSNPEKMEMLIKVHDIDEWLHPTPFYKQSKKLMEQGYSLDFISDKMISQSKVEDGQIRISEAAPLHKVLIIPQAKYMPLATLENVHKLADEGATVIMEALPQDVPGLAHLENRRNKFRQIIQSLNFKEGGEGILRMAAGKGQILLSPDLQKALEFAGIFREELTDTGLKFIRRSFEGGKYYYLSNHTDRTIDTSVPINMATKSVVIMDPQNAKKGMAAFKANHHKTRVRVQMKPGEALILRAGKEVLPGIDPWPYLELAAKPIEIKGKWTLSFTDGGPELPADQQLDQLVSWTQLSDKKAEAFSGSAVYSNTFRLPSDKADEYLLDLGRVCESARVWINGKEVGYLWSIPYQASIGPYLKAGENTIRIEVANLMANRIRFMDQQKIEWRKYHEINFVNINYKPFDASGWEPVPSGLLGPVTITPQKISHNNFERRAL